jgi:hypothetical protein
MALCRQSGLGVRGLIPTSGETLRLLDLSQRFVDSLGVIASALRR